MSNSSDHCWDNNNIIYGSSTPSSLFVVPDPSTINVSSESMSSSLVTDTSNVQLTRRSSSSCGSKPIRRRSRASKKTPTTLLTTNVANFRDLVQQFTGCPKKAITFGDSSYKCPINLNFQQGNVQNLDGVYSYQQPQRHDERQLFVQYMTSAVPQQQQQDYTVSLLDDYVGSSGEVNGFETQLDYPGNNDMEIDDGGSFLV